MTFLDYQGLWDNNANYDGTGGGVHDLVADLGFVNLSASDFHLRDDSAYIDAGSNSGSPHNDFEGEPRPLDGNEDGNAAADIGADEFWLGLRGSKKSSASGFVEPGGTIDYRIDIVNPSTVHILSVVTLSDTLPPYTMYVPGSLVASRGLAKVTDNVLSWYGVSAPNTSISIALQAQVEPTLDGPYAIVNPAELNDNIGPPLTLRSFFLVDPLVIYLPVISQQ